MSQNGNKAIDSSLDEISAEFTHVYTVLIKPTCSCSSGFYILGDSTDRYSNTTVYRAIIDNTLIVSYNST